jgi:ADP-ribose pyrophosphatase YjhB (NUDIX family)
MKDIVSREGLEPSTFCLRGRRSNRLSYRPTFLPEKLQIRPGLKIIPTLSLLRTPDYNHEYMDRTLSLTMQVVPAVAKRNRHVLILVQNEAGNFLLGFKKLYPPNISRMIGGGVDEGEDKTVAAIRELQEETGLTVSANELKYLSTVETDITEEPTGQQYHFISYLFFLNIGSRTLQPTDDLDGIKELTHEELQQLIERFQQLPEGTDPDKGISWNDYGKLFSAIHQIALEELQRVQSS